MRIVETGSLTAAARATRQSLASVSRHLRALEEDLGVELARRTTRKLAISPAGLELHQRALRILGDVDAVRTSLRAGKLRGALGVSLPVTLGQHLAVPRLGPLLLRHPGLSLEVRLEDRLNERVAPGAPRPAWPGAATSPGPKPGAGAGRSQRACAILGPRRGRDHDRSTSHT